MYSKPTLLNTGQYCTGTYHQVNDFAYCNLQCVQVSHMVWWLSPTTCLHFSFCFRAWEVIGDTRAFVSHSVNKYKQTNPDKSCGYIKNWIPSSPVAEPVDDWGTTVLQLHITQTVKWNRRKFCLPNGKLLWILKGNTGVTLWMLYLLLLWLHWVCRETLITFVSTFN